MSLYILRTYYVTISYALSQSSEIRSFILSVLLTVRMEQLASRWILIRDILLWVKGKSVPLQACSGPEGSRNLRLPDFMTTAQ